MNRSSKMHMRAKQPDPRQSATYDRNKVLETEVRSLKELTSPRSPNPPKEA